MTDPNEKPDPEILQRMPDGVDLLHSQAIGKVIMSGYDNFIEGLQGYLKEYPEDAP